MSRHFLDDLSNHAAHGHGIYQRDILYDMLSVTPLLFRDDQAVIFVQAKQNLVWLMSLTTQCSQQGNEVTAISSDSRPPKFEMLDISNCF